MVQVVDLVIHLSYHKVVHFLDLDSHWGKCPFQPRERFAVAVQSQQRLVA
jgi:hypothetical protein